jgi:hypothetical protein
MRVEDLVACHGSPHRGEEEAAEHEGGDERDEEHGEHHVPRAQGSGRRSTGMTERATSVRGLAKRASASRKPRFISPKPPSEALSRTDPA